MDAVRPGNVVLIAILRLGFGHDVIHGREHVGKGDALLLSHLPGDIALGRQRSVVYFRGLAINFKRFRVNAAGRANDDEAHARLLHLLND